MTFLQPFILAALPLALIPVVIHLLNRMRLRPRPWAAMRFLVSANRASTRHARLRQFLILFCRVMAVALLVLFLARPLAGGWLGWALSPAPDAVVVLLDRSASMEARAGAETRREQALRFLAAQAAPFEQSSHFVLIDSASRQAQEFAHAASLPGLDAARPSDAGADIPAMLRAACDWLVDNRAGTAEIWIASDGQRSNWLPDDPRWKDVDAQLAGLPQKPRIRLLLMDDPPQADASIAVHDVVRRWRNGDSQLDVVLDLQRNRSGAATIPVTLTLDGSGAESDVAMDGQSLRWRRRVDLGARTGGGWGSVAVPADGNNANNTAYFVYGADAVLRAAVVSDDLATARCLTLAAAARDGQPAPRIAPADFPAADLNTCALLIWQAPLPSGADADRVRAFASEGGAVLFLPPGEGDSGPAFDGVDWGAPEQSDQFHIRRWNEDEGPLAKTDEHFSLPLPDVAFARRRVMSGQSEVLAAFDDGAAFLVRRQAGRGAFYFCSSLPTGAWSSLGDGPVLVPMTQRLLEAGGRRLAQSAEVFCGDLSPVDRARTWTCVDSPGAKDILTQAGVYRSGDRLLAVNRPPAEDDPEMLDGAAARSLFGPLRVQMMREQREEFGQWQGEIWRLFLVAMLLALIAEAILILPPKTAEAEPEAAMAPQRR